MKAPSTTLISTAYHEAAHAVVALRFGIAVHRATIIPKGDVLGQVTHRNLPKRTIEALQWGSPTPSQRQLVEAHIIISLVGGIAERHFRGRHSHWGSQVDRTTAISLADHLCGTNEEVEAYLRWLWVRAKNCVTQFWPQIDAVARELLEHKTLTGVMIGEIIAR